MDDEFNKEKTREQLLKELADIKLSDKFFAEADSRYSAVWVERLMKYVLIAIAVSILGLIIGNYILAYIHPPTINTIIPTGGQTK